MILLSCNSAFVFPILRNGKGRGTQEKNCYLYSCVKLNKLTELLLI